MDLALNLALLLIGSLSALCAFGGKTWKEGGEPLLERITPRGWVSIVCLIFALAIGVAKEVRMRHAMALSATENQLAAVQARAQGEAKQAELRNQVIQTQAQLDIANNKLADANVSLIELKEEVRFTQDQITGGNGFPVAIILWAFPDKDGTFPLEAFVNGKAPLNDVVYSVSDGVYRRPDVQDIPKLTEQSISTLYGHTPSTERHVGMLNPNLIVPLGYTVKPSATSVNTYRIFFRTRNRSVQEKLDIRFNSDLKIWQYRYLITSEDTRDPNKVLAKEDWIPKKNLPVLYGEGPP